MSFKESFSIAGRRVGGGEPCLLIAEVGRNHNGDIALGKTAIEEAAAAGAEVAKFQSFRAEELLIKELPKVSHIKETSDAAKSAFESTREVELTEEMHQVFAAHAAANRVIFMSTPEDHNMVDLLKRMQVPAFKVASLDIVYLDLVEAIAAAGKPIIMSTGMSYLGEIERALLVLEKMGVAEVALLHCTSNYPPQNSDVNLRAMATLKSAFAVPVGYSDHTLGIGVSIAAVALGACIIERHFTLDKSLPGPDHRISLTPAEFGQMAREIRAVEAALGGSVKRPVPAEEEMRRLHRRRLVAARPLAAGQTLARGDIACKCSAEGLEPEMLSFLVGKKLKGDMVKDQAFSQGAVE